VNEALTHWLRRAGALAARCCSLRHFVLVPTGVVLALSPLTSGTSDGLSVTLLPYAPQSAHQAYGYALAETRLARDPVARAWLAAADRALLEPQAIELPFATEGSFAADAATSLGYSFVARHGQRVRIDVGVTAAGDEDWFVDLFRVTDSGLVRVDGSLPSTPGVARELRPLEVDVVDDGSFVLRVQPQIAAAADYTVRFAIAPLLAFPVQGHDARAIWSGFGAERDGGRRAHRGVDIFAARGTTALAATDSWVVRVETTRVGGNVVWMQSLFGNMRLYYAHLDSQWVEPGQFLRAGEPVGAIGNTGNAITTPPHLHFGFYVRQPGVRGGVRDPAGFLR
jgi:murein DD-endopeptidase MepM/ murein hydrolase activator NlpD